MSCAVILRALSQAYMLVTCQKSFALLAYYDLEAGWGRSGAATAEAHDRAKPSALAPAWSLSRASLSHNPTYMMLSPCDTGMSTHLMCCLQSAHPGVAEGREQARVAAAGQRYYGSCRWVMSPGPAFQPPQLKLAHSSYGLGGRAQLKLRGLIPSWLCVSSFHICVTLHSNAACIRKLSPSVCCQ